MLDAYLLAGRRDAESRMLDTFDIKLSLGVQYDPEQDEDVETFEDLFTTRGRVKTPQGVATRESEVGGRTAVEIARELHIPVTAPAVPAGAVAFCTAVDPTSDPTLAGARLRLAGPAPGSQTTARRLEVTEVIS